MLTPTPSPLLGYIPFACGWIRGPGHLATSSFPISGLAGSGVIAGGGGQYMQAAEWKKGKHLWSFMSDEDGEALRMSAGSE